MPDLDTILNAGESLVLDEPGKLGGRSIEAISAGLANLSSEDRASLAAALLADLEPDLNAQYVTQTDAESTYLTQTAAAATYVPVGELVDGVVDVTNEALERYILGIPLVSFLESDDPLPNDGETDASTLLNTALGEIAALVADDGVPRQLLVPAGDYLLEADVAAHSGVGIKGAGWSTIFRPSGQVRFQVGNIVGETGNEDGSNWFYDNVYEDFQVDCSGQSNGSYNSAYKGFFVGNMIRPIWRRLWIHDSFATGLGADFVIDGLVESCLLEGAGRGHSGDDTQASSGANLGLGVGLDPREKMTVRNCVMPDSRPKDISPQRLELRGATLQTPNAMVIENCLLEDSVIGIHDCGSGGIVARDTVIRAANYGVAVERGGQSTVAGINGVLERVTFGPAPNRSPITTPRAVYFDNGAGGGYQIIDPIIEGEWTDHLFMVSSNANLTNGGLTLDIRRPCPTDKSILISQSSNAWSLKARGRFEGWDLSNAGFPAILFNSGAADDIDIDATFVGRGPTEGAISGVRWARTVNPLIPPRVQGTWRNVAIPVVNASRVNGAHINIGRMAGFLVGDTWQPIAAGTNVNFSAGDRTETTPDLTYEMFGTSTWVRNINGWARNTNSGDTPGNLVVDVDEADVIVAAKLHSNNGTPTTGGVVARCADINNWIMLTPYGTGGKYALVNCVAGSASEVDVSDVTPVIGTDVIELECDGTSVVGRVNGAEVVSATISDHTTVTKHGLRSGGTAWTAFDWYTIAPA